MTQSNPFSELLKGLRDLTEIKTQTLSDALGYDCTYISKWISGAKLPASKSAKRNIRYIANFFTGNVKDLKALQSALIEAGILEDSESSGNPDNDWLYNVLLRRYERQLTVRSEKTRHPAFCLHKEDALDLLANAIQRMYGRGEKQICLTATVDIFSVFGNSFFSLFNSLRHSGVELHITLLSYEPALVRTPDLYCLRVIKILNLPDYPYLTVYIVPEPPSHGLIVLRSELAMSVIMQDGMFLAAFCSDDPQAVDILYKHCIEVFNDLKPVITPTSLEALHRTDIQLGSSLSGNLMFFSDAPSFLVPPEVLGALCKRYADDPDYVNFLERLSRINCSFAPMNQFDIIIYKSFFLEYLANGIIEIGNRRVTLTRNERAMHIAYLADCMERYAGIHIYMINDAGAGIYRHEKGLSIFIDSRTLSVERTQNLLAAAVPQYHVSSTALLVDSFRSFLNDPAKLKECTELTPARMREYKRNCSDKG